MLSHEELENIYAYFTKQNIQWKIKGTRRSPTREEIELLLDDLITAIRTDEGDISIEIGSILVKRSDSKIDIYVHAGAVDFND